MTEKAFVVTVDSNKCLVNDKDPQALDLIKVANTYGTVEPLERVLAKEAASLNATIKALRDEIYRLKAFDLSSSELKVLDVIREKATAEAANYEEQIKLRDDKLNEIKAQNESTTEQIIALLGNR